MAMVFQRTLYERWSGGGKLQTKGMLVLRSALWMLSDYLRTVFNILVADGRGARGCVRDGGRIPVVGDASNLR